MSKGIIAVVLLGAAAAIGIPMAVRASKENAARLTFGVDFSHLVGLVGSGADKFIKPTLQLVFKLNLDNSSGFTLKADKIYSRLEYRKKGYAEWVTAAVQESRLEKELSTGTATKIPYTLDVKGNNNISFLLDPKGEYRMAVHYMFRGVPETKYFPVKINEQVITYWTRVQREIPAVKSLGLVA